jgi:hypothetical protein
MFIENSQKKYWNLIRKFKKKLLIICSPNYLSFLRPCWASWTGLHLVYAGLDYAGLVYAGLDYAGLDYAGLDYAGLDYAGLVYAGLDYAGLDYAGLVYAGLDYAGLVTQLSCSLAEDMFIENSEKK